MSSRFYTPLDEEANDPRYYQGVPFEDEAAAFEGPQGGQPSANPSPFEEPPSVRESKASKLVDQDPFDDPELDKRIKGIDEQIASRPRSLGGMIAAFSPSGDKTMASLMAQRHMYGQEQHGNQQLRRQMAGQRAAQERAFAHDKAIQANADRNATARENAARTNADSRVTVGGGHDAARMYGADQSLAATQYRTDNQQFAPSRWQPVGMTTIDGKQYMVSSDGQSVKQIPLNGTVAPMPGKGGSAGKAPVDPRVSVWQAELRQLTKALNDPATPEANIPQLQGKYNTRMNQLKSAGVSVTQPSAAPSTAPGVKQTANDDLGAAPDGASGTGTVTLDDGSKVRVKIVNGRYIRA